MKTLIIFDSLYGNTEKLARAIGKEIDNSSVTHVSKVQTPDLKGIDLLIVGSPTHGGRPSPSIKQLLTEIQDKQLQNTKIAAFDTGISSTGQSRFLQFIIKLFGYASAHIDRALCQKGGIRVAEPVTFFVKGKEGPLAEGELEKTKSWVQQLKHSLGH